MVLEIGPGLGGLTEALATRAGRLVAIEKDRDLIAPLRRRVPGAEIIDGDALDLDWHRLLGRPARWLVAGNIPYNITSPLIDRALQPPRPARIVFLVQREVADRLAAAPGGKAYGALSVGVQAVAGVDRLFRVSAGAFQPPPEVDSALVRITPRENPMLPDTEAPRFRRFVVGIFGFRRKQISRGLRELGGWAAEQAGSCLASTRIEGSRRPETLNPEEFLALFRAWSDHGGA